MQFYLDSQAVGYFDLAPFTEGDHVYEPLRSPGHLNLMMQLRASHIPRCHYISGDNRIEFSVVSLPRYGVLRLNGFEISNVNTTPQR